MLAESFSNGSGTSYNWPGLLDANPTFRNPRLDCDSTLICHKDERALHPGTYPVMDQMGPLIKKYTWNGKLGQPENGRPYE